MATRIDYARPGSDSATSFDSVRETAEPERLRFPVLRIPRARLEPLALTIEPVTPGEPWPPLPGGPVFDTGEKGFSVKAFENELIERLNDRCRSA
jgi:hypothetical protein